MLTTTRVLSFLALLAITTTTVPAAQAQSFGVGVDIVSRYVWRGTDFGESASMQPALSFSAGGFEIGSWASYAVSPEAAGVNEHDLYMSYGFETTRGTFTLGVTDYYFPVPFDGLDDPKAAQFFNFDGDGAGAHWIEPFVGYSGPAAFPIQFTAALFVHNDPDHSVYLEASYPFALNGTDLGLTLGAVPGASDFYGTDGFALVNVGFSATHAIPLTETFALPVSVSYILNPDVERTFLVFGISL